HRAFGSDASQRNGHGLQRMRDSVLHRGCFITRMHHAVGALLVISGSVGIPVGCIHQLIEGLRIALAEQVAGLLPAKDSPGRISPWGAVIALVSGEEVEEQA